LILFVDRGSHRIHYALWNLSHIVSCSGVLGSLRQHFFLRVAAGLETAPRHQIIATKDF
jgi:hypothetical protein